MKKKFTLSHCCKFFAIVLIVFGFQSLDAQTINSQLTTVMCQTGLTNSSANTSGTALPTVNFPIGTGAGQIPANHRIVEVIVEVVWSKNGSCGAVAVSPINLEEVGFQITGPPGTGGSTRYLAASNGTGGFTNSGFTTNTFTGTFPGTSSGIVNDTTVFRDGASSTIPVIPTGMDTIAPNNDSLNFYCNLPPHGNWSVGFIDDAPGGPHLCVHSYCITLITCDPASLSVTCEAFPVVGLEPSGLHTFEFADLDSLSDVSCFVKDIKFVPATADCSNIGTPLPVTMTIRDHLNNVSSCASVVTIVDTSAPVIPFCSQPFGTIFTDLYLDANGRDTFFASSVPMSDNCGAIIKEVRNIAAGSPWQPFVAFNCVTGFQQFFVRGQDAAGNMDSCRFIVQVIDTIPPTAVCGQDTAYVGNGAFTMAPISLDAGSFDICPPITGRWINNHLGVNPVYTCADIGSDTISLIVSDASNNLDTCSNAVVIVLDTTAPTAVCQNVNVYLNAAGIGMLLATDVDNGSIDTCSVDSVNINGVASIAYDCSHIGTTQNVTLNVFDGSGNTSSCVANITVLDTFPPTAICQNFTTYINASGVAVIQADSLNNNSTDVCTGSNLNFFINGNSTANFSCADISSNPNAVTLTVQDANGNGSTCIANITVLDTIGPIANCASPTVYLNNAGLATVSAAELSLGNTDNCSVVDSFVNVQGITSANFTCSAIFTPQPTTLIVEDETGNLGTCITNVTVVDTVRPTALCYTSYTATLGATGDVTVTPADIDSASTDNCGLVEYLINGASTATYTCSDIGSLGAVLLVRDSSGNIRSCPTTINVIDNTPPTASCQITTVHLGSSGTVAITPNDVLVFPATGDNCGAVTTSFLGGGTNIIYDCDSISLSGRVVNVVVTDGANNTATCQTTVAVLDTVSPIASCRPVPYTVQLDTSGNGFVVPMNINNGSLDICGVDTMLVNGVDTFFYTCANIGNSAVTLSVLDSSRNLSTCVANVIIADNINPIPLCHDTTFYLNASGVATVFPADIDAGSSDNCTFTRKISNLPSVTYNCNRVGINTAQLVITDGANNTTQCSANIRILDTITPVANCIAPNIRTVYLDNTCFASVPASEFNNNSTDNCSSSLTFRVGGLPNATFTSANLTTNPNPLILTVCDGSNNCSTCNTSVIVRDTTPPTMVCTPDTVQLDGLGNAVVIPSNINGGSSDNCSVPSYTINGGPLVNMTCVDLGTRNVTLTGIDQSGNADSCTTTVFVQDITPPNASCNGTVTVVLDAFTSIGTLLVADVNNGSTDNCMITNYTLSRTSFDCGDIPSNPHSITMLIADQSNNFDSCTIQVTVRDTVAPVAVCTPTPVDLYLIGSTVSTTAVAIDNGSVDNCAIATRTLSQSTFNCSNIGSNVVTLTVIDSSGNAGTCTATINVTDTLGPTPFCSNPTVALNSNGTVTVAATDLASSSFDNCLIDTMLVNGQDSITFSCVDTGLNVVTVFMTDPSNNPATCSSTITVVDNENPTAICTGTPIQLLLDSNGIAVLNPIDANGGSIDNCTITNYALSQDTFNCSNISNNPNNVTLIVTDQSGNTDNCIAQVNVVDTVLPTMSCQPVTVNIHLSVGGVAPVSASMFDAGTIDACGIGNLSFTGAPNLVTCVDVGTRPVTLIATDANGNMDSCATTLTVFDTVSPTITCNNITVNLNSFGNASIDSTTASLYSVTDACGVNILRLNADTIVNYTCADVGQDTVLISAIDVSGNTSFCSSIITIQDVTAPSITCGITTQYLDTNGVLTIDPAWITANIIEACGVDTMYTTPDTLTCANVGPFNSVMLTVVDVNGNSSTCNGNIEVVDTVPPNMVCRDTTVCLSGGFVNVTAADIDGGTTDACGMSGIQTINGSNNVIFTCANLGVQTVVLQREDVNGNTNTCNANVTVKDCTLPTAICKTNYTAQVGINGFAIVQAIDLDFGSTDDCGIDSSTFKINGLDSLAYSCNVINNPIAVTFTVSDFSGNTDTCISTITIQDTVNPVARCGGPINAVLSASSGQFTVPAFNLNNTTNPSGDNCTISSYLINGQSQFTYDCSMLGTNTAVLTVTDQSGNTDTCNAIVNVQDITPPTATCQFTTNLILDSTGQVLLPASALITTSSDNCGIGTIQGNGQDTLIFTCDSIGSNQISVVVTDSSGNPFTCSAIVNIADNIDPVAICPTLPVPAYVNGNSIWVTAAMLDSASFDNCQITDYQINGTDSVLYNCGQINTFPQATLTVIDASNNSNTCPVTIEVLDTIPPVAHCSSFVVTLSPAGVAYVNPSAIDSLSTDNCGLTGANSFLINNQTIDTFDCSNVGGSNIAVLTVIDQYNNTSFCTTTITVVDATPPSIQCPLTAIDFYLGSNGIVNVDPRDIATASDTCSVLFWYINNLPDSTFDCSHVGIPHVVTIKVEDPSGNSAQCNAILNIKDTISPTAFCQNLTVALDSIGSVVVTGADIGAFNTDNCAIIDTLINGQNSITYTCDSIPAPGDSIIAILTVTDAAGNQNSCQSTITLLDNIGPVITCNDTVTVQLNQQGVAIVQAVSLASNTFDACTPLNYQINALVADTFDCSDVGNFPLAVLTVTDANGNQSTCFSIMEVLDEVKPDVICRNVNVYLNSNGNATLLADSIDGGSQDNCLILSKTFSGGGTSMALSCVDTGLLNVILVVEDIYGNIDSCTAIVTVRDTTPPNVICNGVTVDLTQTGQVLLTTGGGLNSVATAGDNCGLDTIFVTPDTITCTNIGNVLFTVTAIDHSGNVGSCEDTARVFLERPTIILPTQDTVLCEGDTLPLSAIVPPNGISYSYEWNGPAGQITTDPTVLDTIVTNIAVTDEGYYIFTIAPPSGNGCPASDSIYLDVNEVQPPILTGVQPCDGDSAILYLANSSTYIGSLITYNWYFNGNLISNNPDSLIIPNMSVADSGVYSMSIQVVQGPAACSDSSLVGLNFDVLDLPAAPVPSANLPCEGQNLTLLNNAPGNTYSWTGPAGFSTTLPNPTRPNATQAFAGLYVLTITDVNNCSNSSSVNVTISPTPAAPNVFYTAPLCIGDLLELQDTSTYNFSPVLYIWKSPAGTVDTTTIGQLILSGASSGEYTLTVSMNGCPSATADTAVVIYEAAPTGTADFFTIEFRDSLTSATAGGNNIINNDNPNAGGYLLAIVDSTFGGTVRLNNVDGTINYVPRSGFFGNDTMTYSLCDAQCPSSCDTIEAVIEVTTDFECFIPQGISPNGDNINDEIIVRCRNQYPDAVMKIFSRWGTLVYEGAPTGWNGQFNGQDLPDGTYFYVLKLNDTTYTGTGANPDEGRVGDEYSGYIMLQR